MTHPRYIQSIAVQDYLSGLSSTQVAKLNGVDKEAVLRWVRKAGHPVRPKGGDWHSPYGQQKKMPGTEEAPRKMREKAKVLINLFELSGGDCFRLRGLCSFDSCRYRLPGGGCCLKLANMGAMSQVETATALGITKQAVKQMEERLYKKVSLKVLAEKHR